MKSTVIRNIFFSECLKINDVARKDTSLQFSNKQQQQQK